LADHWKGLEKIILERHPSNCHILGRAVIRRKTWAALCE
jgi:hypothetical protein